jgi:hypothetical protein
MSRRPLIVATVTLGVLAAGSAPAQAKQYVLGHPKHERCKAHYVKRVEKVKVSGRVVKETVCVYNAPQHAAASSPAQQPTPLPPTASTPAPAPSPAPSLKQLEPSHTTEVLDSVETITFDGAMIWSFAARVDALEEPYGGNGPIRVPLTSFSIRYKITDTTTGVVEADPTITTRSEVTDCSFVESFDYPKVIFNGEGSAGCGFDSFTTAGPDKIEVVPSFVGLPGYLPSEGTPL